MIAVTDLVKRTEKSDPSFDGNDSSRELNLFRFHDETPEHNLPAILFRPWIGFNRAWTTLRGSEGGAGGSV